MSIKFGMKLLCHKCSLKFSLVDMKFRLNSFLIPAYDYERDYCTLQMPPYMGRICKKMSGNITHAQRTVCGCVLTSRTKTDCMDYCCCT
jgi:hypothetical protein